MFGYIRVCKEELKIKEYYLFRAYYCGLCRELKKRYGQMSRFLLNYDLTFFALFLASQDGGQISAQRCRCIAHPLQKRPMIYDNPYLSYAADLNLLLACQKMRDDWQDERSFTSRCGLVFLARDLRAACRRRPEAQSVIEQKTAELSRLEKEKSPEIDRVADTFASLLSGLIPAGDASPARDKAARWFAYNLGKWIYLIDAFDDLAEDLKENRYNPYIYGYDYQGEGFEAFREKIKPQAEFLLTCALSQVSQSFDLLDIKVNRGILENIIYLGMLEQTDKVLNQRSCEKGEKLLRDSRCQRECHQGRNP